MIDRTWYRIDRLFIIIKIVSSVAFLCYGALRRNTSFVVIGIILFAACETIVSVANGSLTISFFLSTIMPMVGFAYMCKFYMSKYRDCFLDGAYCLFSFLSFTGALMIFLFPYGFNHTAQKAGAIYFLGSKNNSFFYYFIYLLLSRYRKLRDNAEISLFDIIKYLFLISSLVVCESVNGGLMIAAIIFYYVLEKKRAHIMRILTPKTMLVGFFVITILIPTVLLNSDLRIFALLNRTSSFSGRDFIWAQALVLIKKHPFLGNGIGTFFYLNTSDLRIAAQAHNIFLDIAARYGIISLAILLGLIIYIIAFLQKGEDKKISRNNAFFLIILMIHSLFDFVSMYFLIFSMIMSIGAGEETKQTLKTMIDN